MDTITLPAVEEAVEAYAKADGYVHAPGPEAQEAARSVEVAGPGACT